MRSAEARIAFLVRGVVRQAMSDAGVQHVSIVGRGARRDLVERWCEVRVTDPPAMDALLLSTASKTELLLGGVPRADVHPLGDLYASELEPFCGSVGVSPPIDELAERAGLPALDRALRRLLDERRDPEAAFAHAPQIRNDVLQLLERTRFHRSRIGVVPKIGARTLGIDLLI